MVAQRIGQPADEDQLAVGAHRLASSLGRDDDERLAAGRGRVAAVEAARREVAPVGAPTEGRVEALLGSVEGRHRRLAQRQRNGGRARGESRLLPERDPVSARGPHGRELLAFDARARLDGSCARSIEGDDVQPVHHALGLDLRCDIGEHPAVRREPPVARDVIRGMDEQLDATVGGDPVQIRPAVRKLRVEQRAIARERDREDAEAGRHLQQRAPRARGEVNAYERLRAVEPAAAIDEVAPLAVEHGRHEQVGVACEAGQLAAGDVEQPQFRRRITARRRIARQHGESDERARHLGRGCDRPAAGVRDPRDDRALLEVARGCDVDPVLGRAELGEDELRLGGGLGRVVVAIEAGEQQRGAAHGEEREHAKQREHWRRAELTGYGHQASASAGICRAPSPARTKARRIAHDMNAAGAVSNPRERPRARAAGPLAKLDA